MSLTVRYRGVVEDRALIEMFEDCVVDLSLELGGTARVWRSWPSNDTDQAVSGVLLDLAPGLGTVGLLVSSEGWLMDEAGVSLTGEACLGSPPWVSLDMRGSSLESHVALLELLICTRDRFAPGLEVVDEGGYWETRDLSVLRRNRRVLDERGGLPDEEVQAAQIDRLVRVVRGCMLGVPEHPPARFGGPESPWSNDPGTEEEWDSLYRETQRRHERIQRRLEEAQRRGIGRVQALLEAMCSEGLDPEASQGVEGVEAVGRGLVPDPEPWLASLRPSAEESPKPLLQRAQDLAVRCLRFAEEQAPEGTTNPLDQLARGVLELMGGISQVLGAGSIDEVEEPDGWALVQMKRALRGAAFARGAMTNACSLGFVPSADSQEVSEEIASIEGEMVEMLRQARRRLRDRWV